ncbi:MULTISPECIES: thiol-disulfide oxidoreductase DCC family protein [unclassified Agarivorans]|uniref:thiol-disulfide oxidoreductase DCC family protein n=1 Tax=unclassified Agarivorans TaxID=2636026 RepID=UPI003D7D0DD7
MQLRIFYDAQCPLCAAEMRQLKSFDTHQLIELQDINQTNFKQRFPHINRRKAANILHAENAQGELLLGLDVTAKAWGLVQQKPWIQWLRKPIIRCVADRGYLLFAKHRYRISALVGRHTKCDSQHCGTGKNLN